MRVTAWIAFLGWLLGLALPMHGQTALQPPLPATEAERRALAERQVAQYETLDDAERLQLAQLSPYALPLLMARYVAWTKTYAAHLSVAAGQPIYHILRGLPPILEAACRKNSREDTEAILNAWLSVGPRTEWSYIPLRLLRSRGEPSVYVPPLIRSLQHVTPEDRWASDIFQTVAQASSPEAVAFCLKLLRDPYANPNGRYYAFLNLPNTAGEEGARAVLAVRSQRHPGRPWYETLDLDQLDKDDIVGVETDDLGRTWMLFHSCPLGNMSDLFLVQKLKSGWDTPLFTGVWTDARYHQVRSHPFHGIPIARLIASEWIHVLPDDPTLRQDSDGDGLADLVEERLGTDPYKADTDGDGLSDLLDPCPNAAPRPLNDTEKIIAACMEARFFESDDERPAILAVEGVRPFKIYHYLPTLIWGVPGKKLPLASFYGGGLNRIYFDAPKRAPENTKSGILYDADHRTAHTLISCYSGPLAGNAYEMTLRKIGDDWFVVEMKFDHVS